MVCRTFNREQKKLNFHIFSSNKGHNYNRDREREWCQCGEGGVLKRKCLTEIIGAAMMMTSPVKIMKYPYCNIFVLSSNLSSCSYNALLALYAFNRWNCNFYHLFSSALREKKTLYFKASTSFFRDADFHVYVASLFFPLANALTTPRLQLEFLHIGTGWICFCWLVCVATNIE